MIISMATAGLGQVLSSVGGLALIGYIGQGVMEEMGWRRLGTAWSIAIYIGGSLVIAKYFANGVKAAFEILSF